MPIQYKKYDNPCLCLFILLVVFTVHVEVASLNTSGFHTLGFTLVTLLVSVVASLCPTAFHRIRFQI